ncbi:hypothetical protein AK812_SmicGene37639 [Symbiodinium microadriaticum]|uniref:Uncharacterized protein n=1 Tax=Symbiodinium microadriaticum TaxID=2951 RepID=A0A1Q9CFR8_SYMMI|nr:hypothetical protein AK812_SmicGene37639 [Symbiodinium microadriaticum]
MLPLLSGLKSPGASISKGRWLTVQEVRLQRQEAIVGRAAKESSAGNSERQSLKGRFVLDLSRFGSPVRLDVTAFADKVRSDKWLLLAACLLIDFIGMASYLVLLLGEVTDIMWAPFAGFLLQYLFGSWLVSSLGALEEFLPFTDILPTATLAWAICHLEWLGFLRVQDSKMKFPARQAGPESAVVLVTSCGSRDPCDMWVPRRSQPFRNGHAKQARPGAQLYFGFCGYYIFVWRTASVVSARPHFEAPTFFSWRGLFRPIFRLDGRHSPPRTVSGRAQKCAPRHRHRVFGCGVPGREQLALRPTGTLQPISTSKASWHWFPPSIEACTHLSSGRPALAPSDGVRAGAEVRTPAPAPSFRAVCPAGRILRCDQQGASRAFVSLTSFSRCLTRPLPASMGILPIRPWQASPAPAQAVQVRSYNLRRVIPWFRVRTNVLKQETKMRTTKNRNHAEVLKRFRLTRFGWERRRAHLRDGKKRRRSPQQKRNTNKIDFVHRHDMLKMVRTATYFKLRIRDFPKDPNPNIKSTRAIVGSHFG